MVRDVAMTKHHGPQCTSDTVNVLTNAGYQICAGAGSLAELLKDIRKHRILES